MNAKAHKNEGKEKTNKKENRKGRRNIRKQEGNKSFLLSLKSQTTRHEINKYENGRKIRTEKY